MVLKYKWLWRLRNTLGTMTFKNHVRPGQAYNLSTLVTQMSELLDTGMTWSDVEWLRRIWKKPLLIKGILLPEEAQKEIDLGVDGIIVSNHGGCQLDGAIASINALPDVIGKVEE